MNPMPQPSPTPGAAPQPAPRSFTLTDAATLITYPLTACTADDLVQQLESLYLFGGISHTTACALAHAGFGRGHGAYLVWEIQRGDG